MNATKTLTKLLVSMILLSCFASLYTAQPAAAVSNTQIVFNQTGLATGTTWMVNIGGSNFSSTGSSLSLLWVDGIPYNWQVYVPAGYTSSSTLSGTFTLNFGETRNIYVAFTPLQNYNVSFIETGLASGTTWGVTFDGVQYSSSTPVLTITGCSNGSYAYTIDTPNGYLIGTQASATLTVAGASVVKPVTFASSTSSDWYMSRRDALHSGYADTSAPLTNTTLWITHLNEITTSSPAIVNGILYIGTGNGTIYALDTVDGSIIWEYTTGGAVKSSPAVVAGVVYVASDDQYLYALDATDGSLIWRYNVGGSNLNVSPTVVDGTVYFGQENNLFSINATDGSLIWEKTISGYFESSSPTVVDGVIYFGMYDSRRVFALNASDGSEIWNINTWSHVCSSPTVVKGIVYVGNNEGRLYALNATATGDPYLWDVHLGGSSAMFVSSPAYCNGVIYIGDTEGTMYARNATDGSLIWTYATDGAIWSSPAIVDGTVYVASGDGKVYAFNTLISTVTFTESGLPSGTSWTVTLDGITKTSNDNSIDFTDIAYGTYDYTINTPTGYIASVTSGSITVNGAETQQTVTLSAIPYNWWMLGNGVTHTGYSSSTGPLTNDVLWSKSVASLGESLSGCATPVVADGVLYLKFSGTIFALDAYNSTLIRSYDLGSSYYCPQSPAVADGILYAGTGAGEVLAFNTTTGDTIWTFTADAGIVSSPTVENGVLYIGSIDYKLYAINVTTGVQLWSYQTDGRVNFSPAVSNGIVVFGSEDGKLYALDVQTGSQIWNYSTAYSYSNEAPCIVDGVVYAGQYYSSNGNFSALNLTTGAKIWSISKSVWGSVAMANGVVYLNSNGDGFTYAVNATTGAELWSYETLALYQSPIVTNDVVYVQGLTQLHALNSTNGDLIWSYSLFSIMPGSSSPVIADGIVYAVNEGGMGGPMMSGTIYAFGVPNQYTLTMNSVGHGTVSPGNQTSIAAGTTLDLVAIPDEGWVFEGWSGDASGTTNTTIIMNSNKVVTATFTENPLVNLVIVTVGQGSVIPGNASYSSGSSVDLKAIPAAGWSFSGWSGDASGIENTTITMAESKTVTATFTQDTYYLTMITVGQGTVTPGNSSYLSGATVDIKAFNSEGWIFGGWTGAAVGSENRTLTMTSNLTVTATFTQNSYTLTIITSGQGTVLPGNQSYLSGTVVDLEAINTAGWTFEGWTGDASGTTNTSITMTTNKTVTATFTQNSYTLTMITIGQGTVSAGNQTVLSNTVIDLEAFNAAGWSFSGWTGDVSGSQNTTITMTGNKTVTATFTQDTYYLTLITIGQGTVTPGNSSYLSGTTVDIKAFNAAGWTFSGWTGSVVDSANTTITMNGNKTITAAFTQNIYNLTIITSGQGTVSPGNHTYLSGEIVDLEAINAAGWTFAGWTGDASGSTNTTITMDGNKTVSATFTQDSYTLTMITIGQGTVNPGNQTYLSNSVIDLEAFNAAGWTFAGWTGNASGTANTTITMTGNKTVTATFTQDTYYLTMITVGQGTVTPGNSSYLSGTTIDLEAINQIGWTFDSWSGAVGDSTNTTLLLNGNKTVTATFTQNNYTLTIITIGNGAVTPANQTLYHYGDNVSIAATCTNPWLFAGWSGSVVSGNTNTTLIVTGNMTVTATFALNSHIITVIQSSHGTITPGTIAVIDGNSQSFSVSPDIGYHIVDVIVDSVSVGSVASYTFTSVQEDHRISAVFAADEYTLTIITVGDGSVTKTPENATYHYGDTVQLNAFPNNGWAFNDWSGDASGTTNTTIVMNGNKTVTANFTQNSYQVVFDLTGVSSTAAGVVLTVDGVGYTAMDLPKTFTWMHGSTHTYSFNQTLSVSNGARYIWSSTTGLSTLQSGSLTVTGAGTVTGTYSTQYLLTVTTLQGSVSGSGWYTAGTSASATVSQTTVTSGTDTRHIFDCWSGDVSSSQAPVSILMDEPKTVAANWQTQYKVTVTANPTNSGSTMPSTVTWMSAGKIEISCTANADYSFTSWTSTKQITINSPSSAATAATINGPGTIIANFNQSFTTLYAKTLDGKDTELKLFGNITASQLSNAKITRSTASLTTKISFSATGQSGTVGFSNITIPKSSVAFATKPVVYIDGVKAENQGYTHDNENYYVWFTTHFSEHEISIDFTSDDVPSTETPTATLTSIQDPATSNLNLHLAIVVVIIAAVLVGLFIQTRRKHKN
ncbi:MAG: PQQ-binding-like beta-propeller repeat protein [Candidatus Bathyarchaeia archaeon]|jgi:uncharacterized repeat protein (TIGR02543 family)